MLHHLERRLHEDRGDRTDDDDHERRGGQQRLDARTLQHCADENRAGGQDQAEKLRMSMGSVASLDAQPESSASTSCWSLTAGPS